jgi:hypothetical protein
MATGHREPFTIELLPTVYDGLIEEVRTNNDVGEGGFAPTYNAVLTVAREDLSFRPWTGMRVTVYGQEMQVADVSENPYRWQMTLQVAHPLEQATVPEFTEVLATSAGTLLFGPSNNPYAIQ